LRDRRAAVLHGSTLMRIEFGEIGQGHSHEPNHG
jgi:hypothetical protein